MQDRVFQPVSGPLYDAENNMKPAPQLRLGNEWEGRTQTRSKRNNGCRFQRNRCGFLPLITVWLQVRVLPGPPRFALRATRGAARPSLSIMGSHILGPKNCRYDPVTVAGSRP